MRCTRCGGRHRSGDCRLRHHAGADRYEAAARARLAATVRHLTPEEIRAYEAELLARPRSFRTPEPRRGFRLPDRRRA